MSDVSDVSLLIKIMHEFVHLLTVWFKIESLLLISFFCAKKQVINFFKGFVGNFCLEI